MKNTKKVLSGILSMAMIASLAACNGDDNGGGGGGGTGTEAATTTTTARTVEVNTETLSDEEQAAVEGVMSQLVDEELENKTIKWLGNYSHYPDGGGASKTLALEMFEQKYDGVIQEYQSSYDDLFNNLANYLQSDEGIDFCVFDEANLPAGIISGKFLPVDDYVDWDSPLWQYTKEGMELFNFGGKHFMFVTAIESRVQCWYNKKTIEDNGYDDPWELWEAGNWNWDTFREMLIDFSDNANGYIGLDNWFFEAALYMSSGVTAVSMKDGHLVSNISDPGLAKAMEFGYDLYQNDCTIDRALYGYNLDNVRKMGDGTELFDITGYWEFTLAPETWNSEIPPEYLDVVPVPSPAGGETFAQATPTGFQLCKGSKNPMGVARYVECNILASIDEEAIAISDRKALDDYGWTQDTIDHLKAVHENARLHPVYDIAAGVSTMVRTYTVADSEQGVRAPFHGFPWAEQVAALADPVGKLVEEADSQLQAALEEFK